MHRLIRENTMQSCFPNVEILLRMYLSDGHELHWRAFVYEAATKGAATRYDSPARSLPIALYMGQS